MIIFITLVVIVLIVILFLFNYNVYINNTKQEIDKLTDSYFEKLDEKEKEIYDYKIDSIDNLISMVNDMKDVVMKLNQDINTLNTDKEIVKNKISNIEFLIDEKNNNINNTKKEIIKTF